MRVRVCVCAQGIALLAAVSGSRRKRSPLGARPASLVSFAARRGEAARHGPARQRAARHGTAGRDVRLPLPAGGCLQGAGEAPGIPAVPCRAVSLRAVGKAPRGQGGGLLSAQPFWDF